MATLPPFQDPGSPMGERERLAEVLMVFGRHGMRGLAARLGLGSARDEEVRGINPDAVVAMLRELGPVTVKFGQVLAMRSDLLGPEWIRALSTLQDKVPALAFEDIEAVVREGIGGPIADKFASFERHPLAAASIAQVHAATLRDGTSVIVKIRRPEIERRVDADLRLLRRLARAAERRIPEVARLKPDEMLRYFAENLDREMDLSAEGRASDQIGDFLAGHGVRTAWFDWDLTGRQINVQQRLFGVPATDLEMARARGFDLIALGRCYAQAVLRMIIFNGQFHADPHPGNVIFLDDGTLAFIDFGAVGTLLPKRREELVRLSLAIAAEDTAGVVDTLLTWAGDPDVDRQRLEHSLDLLIMRFKDVVLGQIDLGQVFQQVFALLREYRLALPPDLALVLRTLLTAEGFVRRIDPTFDIAAELAPIARELIAERTSPTRLRKEAKRLVAAFGRAVFTAPDMIGQIERIARTGSLPVTIAARDLDVLRNSGKSRVGDQAIIPAAFFICAAIIADSMPILALATATLASVLLAYQWLRSKWPN